MYVEVNMFSASVLLLVFAVLLLISRTRRSSERSRRPVRGGVKQERRAHPRYKTSLRIKYKTPIEEGISWIKDISQSGARLFLNNTLKTLGIGDPLEIEIDLPYEAQPILVKGNIVWSKDDDAGFRFAEVIKDDIDRIMSYVTNEQKQTA